MQARIPFVLAVLLLPVLAGCTDAPESPTALLVAASTSDSRLLYIQGRAVVGTATAGFGAATLAIDVARDRAYVGSSKAATVAVIGLSTGTGHGTIVTTAGAGAQANIPSDIALDAEGRLWVTLPGAGRLQRYAPFTHDRVADIDLPGADRVVASLDGRTLAVVHGTGLSLLEVTGAGLRPTSIANVTLGAVAAVPEGFAVSLETGLRILGPDGMEIRSAAAPAMARALLAHEDRLYLAGAAGRLWAVDLATFRVLSGTTLPAAAGALAHDGSGRLFASMPEAKSIAVVNDRTLALIDQVPLDEPPGEIQWTDLGDKRFDVQTRRH